MNTSYLSGLLLICSISTTTMAQYLPKKDQLSVSTGFSNTTFDEFYSGPGGETEGPTPGNEEIERNVFRTYLYYGIEDNLAVDFSFAIADVQAFEGVPDTVGNQTEFADFTLGLNWQPFLEATYGFDLLTRVGINIEGTYETGALSAPGDGANGIDLGVKFGRTLTDSGIRGDVALNYYIRGEGVPDSFSIKVGPSIPLPYNFNLDAGLIYFTSTQDGLDIGGPDFGTNRLSNPSPLRDLPLVEEEGTVGEVGLSLSSGRYYWRASISQLFDGKNVGKELTFGISLSLSFDDVFN
ncbi:MAG: hypothetical protein AAF212_08290 [Verrucomicrobiota bacterium]